MFNTDRNNLRVVVIEENGSMKVWEMYVNEYEMQALREDCISPVVLQDGMLTKHFDHRAKVWPWEQLFVAVNS